MIKKKRGLREEEKIYSRLQKKGLPLCRGKTLAIEFTFSGIIQRDPLHPQWQITMNKFVSIYSLNHAQVHGEKLLKFMFDINTKALPSDNDTKTSGIKLFLDGKVINNNCITFEALAYDSVNLMLRIMAQKEWILLPFAINFEVVRYYDYEDERDAVTWWKSVRFTNKPLESTVDKTNLPDDIDNDTCSICLEELTNWDTVTRLGCSNIFHSNCIANWLEDKQTCPLCRRELVVYVYRSI